jgi:zinc transporter ZupT
VFIFASFIEALAFGMIPVKVKSFRESPRILGIANAFSGGVFLAIALTHIMPE